MYCNFLPDQSLCCESAWLLSTFDAILPAHFLRLQRRRLKLLHGGPSGDTLQPAKGATMTTFPLPLNGDETILQTDEQAAHVKNNLLGYNVIYGTLWLTDQRLVFRSALLANTLSYPLSRVADAARKEVSLSQRQSPYSSQSDDAALYVEFENGGKECFLTEDLSAWATALLSARSAAPALPFTQVTPTSSLTAAKLSPQIRRTREKMIIPISHCRIGRIAKQSEGQGAQFA